MGVDGLISLCRLTKKREKRELLFPRTVVSQSIVADGPEFSQKVETLSFFLL